MQTRCPVRANVGFRFDLHCAVSFVETHGKYMSAAGKSPIITPQYPRLGGERLLQLRYFPLTVINLHFDLGNAARSRPSYSTDRHILLAIFGIGAARRYGIEHGCSAYTRFL